MKPADFPQASRTLTRPADMTDDECGPLPVWPDGEICVSLWTMTRRERLSALLFGHVWLTVHSGRTQPPVALIATREAFKRTK